MHRHPPARARRGCRPTTLACTLACVLATMSAGAVHAQAPAPTSASQRSFDIPAQPAGEALNAFSQQSSWRILFPYDAVEGKRTRAIVGVMSSQAALDRLLEDTGLLVASRENGVITLCEGRREGGNVSCAPPVSNPQSDTRSLDSVIVTGTRFGNRTVLESPVPVDVLSHDDMRSGGYSDTPSMLAALVPSFQFPPNNLSNSSSFMRRASLRGLGAAQTLVLVNGKRRHLGTNGGFSAADFNAFPPTAIGHIEVLRDGAAAQYGSDAIAGVINVMLRRDLGTQVETTIGQTYEGDGETVETSIDHGFAIGDGGFLHASLYFRKSEDTNRQGYDKRQMYFGTRNGQPIIFPTTSVSDATPVLQPGDTLDPREATIDRMNTWRLGEPRRDEKGLFLNAELPIGDAVGYAFGGYMRREVETPFVFRAALDRNNVRAIYPDGFQPLMLGIVDDASLNVGIKGAWGDWDYDLSQGWGSNRTRPYPRNTLNPSMGTASPTEFYTGRFALQQAVTNLDLRRSFDTGWDAPLYLAVGAEYRWDQFDTRAGWREGYIHGGVPVLDGPSAGGLTNAGSQGFGALQPGDEVDVDRNNVALYADLESTFRERLTLSAAARFERYSDFGNTFDGKLAFRYAFNDHVALRGSASTGFRAPSLADIHYLTTASAFIDGVSYVSRRFSPSDPVARLMGAKDLTPEESVGYSIGSTFQFFDNRLNLSLDLYQIEVKDQLVSSSFFNDARARAFFIANGYPNISGASFPTNAIDAQVRGLDLTANHVTTFEDGGTLTLTSAMNFNNRKILRVAESPPELAAITDLPLYNRNNLISYSRGQPRRTFNLSARYDIDDWSFFARTVRYGEVFSGSTNPAYDQVFSAKWLTDLSVSAKIGEPFTVTVGVNNAFDVYPDEQTAINNPQGPYRYSALSPFGFSGGYYYLRFKAAF